MKGQMLKMDERHLRKPAPNPKELQKERQMREAAQAQLRAEKAKRKKLLRKKKIRRTALYAVFGFAVFMILAGVIAGSLWFDMKAGKKNQQDLAIVWVDADGKKISVSGKEKNGISYLPLSTFAKTMGYTVSGDVNEMSMVFSRKNQDDFDVASFQIGSPIVQINGSFVTTDAPAFFIDGETYVPESFFYNHITGMTKTQEDMTLTVKLDGQVYGLVLQPNRLTDPPYNLDEWMNGMEPIEFLADLSDFEPYMNPEDRDAYLTLINVDHKLDKDDIPEDLIDVVNTRKDGRDTQRMREYAEKALEAMFIEAAANGYTGLSVTSAYRSYSYQDTLYKNQVAALTPTYGDKAPEKAAEAVTYPGASEHQSGLCADLHNLPAASQAFANTPEYTWLYENCYKFGFILRYPKDKQEITGIMFEPWHYRYVGRYHAEKIMKEGLCLEEYVEKWKAANS